MKNPEEYFTNPQPSTMLEEAKKVMEVEAENEYELLESVTEVPQEKLRDYILERAECITRNTQGDSWDDPEEWQTEAVELAHAIMRFLQ